MSRSIRSQQPDLEPRSIKSLDWKTEAKTAIDVGALEDAIEILEDQLDCVDEEEPYEEEPDEEEDDDWDDDDEEEPDEDEEEETEE